MVYTGFNASKKEHQGGPHEQNPKVWFVFPLDGLADICDFGDATRYSSGYGYGETSREAIITACKYAYQDCTLWNLPNNPVGYLVEFAEDDKKTFFKASN